MKPNAASELFFLLLDGIHFCLYTILDNTWNVSRDRQKLAKKLNSKKPDTPECNLYKSIR